MENEKVYVKLHVTLHVYFVYVLFKRNILVIVGKIQTKRVFKVIWCPGNPNTKLYWSVIKPVVIYSFLGNSPASEF